MSKMDFEYNGELPNIEFLVGTRHAGLLYYKNGVIAQYFKKKRVYGITRKGNAWFAFIRDRDIDHGSIISFKLINGEVSKIETIINNVHRGIHQIDFINNSLVITSPEEGVVIEYKSFPDNITPNRHILGTPKEHFNSLYAYGDKILFLAHNQSLKTKAKSKILVTNKKFKKINVLQTIGECCHNIYRDKSNIITCDSINGRVIINNKPALENMGFVRGLSIADDYVIIGSSSRADDGKNRRGLGSVGVYTKDLKELSRIYINKTQVYEIRRVDKKDYCLSNNSKDSKDGLWIK